MKQLYFTLLAVVTIDGKIAKRKNHISDWGSPEDKDYLHAEMDKCDVIIIGANTFKLVKDRLVNRNCIVFTRRYDILVERGNVIYVNPAKVNLFSVLKKYKYFKIAVLGGTEVYNWFLLKNKIDEIQLTIEPLIFGNGLPLFNKLIPTRSFVLLSVKRLNKRGTLLLNYKKSYVKT